MYAVTPKCMVTATNAYNYARININFSRLLCPKRVMIIAPTAMMMTTNDYTSDYELTTIT